MTNKPNVKIDGTTEVSGEIKKSSSAPVVRLGRGLGRLIPVNNQQNSPEKSAISIVDPRDRGTKKDEGSTTNRTQISIASPEKTSTGKDEKSIFGNGVEQIELAKIRPNPRQPRTDFKASELESLAESISSSGLLQPIVVRQIAGSVDQFEIVAGERRWRAFQMLGKAKIPAIVILASDENSGVWALIENVHRTDLNPMDRALAVQRLSEEFTLTHDQLAKKISLDRSTISNLLRLAELDAETSKLVRQGLISQGHAKALLGVVDLKSRATLADSTIRGEWSVRTLEQEVKRISTESNSRVPRGTVTARRQANVKDLETRLSQLLGTRVTIQLGRKPNTGKVSMEFFSLDQFEGMLGRLGLKPEQFRFEN